MSSKKREPQQEPEKEKKDDIPTVEGEVVDETPPAPEKPEEAAKSEEPKAEEKKPEEPKKPDAEEQLKAEKDRYLRLLAEYDNYRKRSVKERENIYTDVRADTVTKFLPVYDNLVRALEQSTEDEAYRKGVELIMAQFKDVLKSLAVTEIEAVGEKFDPALHNAVMHEEDPEKGEGEIVQELQKGFKLGDKVIRFSMVKTVN